MQFTTNTAAPDGLPEIKKRDEEIKSLLFRAVALYLEDHAEARQELMDLLAEPLAKAS